MPKAADALRRLDSFPQLVRYLEDKLGWPLDELGFDDLTFEYSPAELGLKDEEAASVKAIHQLRPLSGNQPWGIFFVEFEKKKIPIVVLRRILSHLVIKKRASANKVERAAWDPSDLLFISAFGEGASANRELAFAHFHQSAGDLPTLRVLGWDGDDTVLKLEHAAATLNARLQWPANTKDSDAWRAQWASAFRHKTGHVIRTADALAEVLAALAKRIRSAAQTLMRAESSKGQLRTLYKAFKESLIHDLTEQDFADTYAQTITYGLLTAAISRTDMEGGREGTVLIAENVADMVPITNPFLKEMLQTFLRAGGRKGGIDFDELGIQDVVELLRGDETDLPAILRDFGNRTRGEDPVIHFYEHFLSAYNKQLKIQRGVFYTPQPVVSYIVRSVHELLQTEFGLTEGLADTTTWSEMLKRHPDLKLPTTVDDKNRELPISHDEPFVQILDPATGTATFLIEVIDVIFNTLSAKWKTQRLTASEQHNAWNEYVPKHLLPRLHAFELMMAPYAIAHMKMGLKLAETGYRFGTEERARIYLTNALEPAVKQLPLIGFDALAHEAAAVNEIKRHKRFTVVIGNPPYSNFGQLNKNPFILGLLEDYKRGLDEKKLNLDDDYIKFARLAHWLIAQTRAGIVGMITNNSFLDGLSHRRMREALRETFGKLSALDLGGSVMRGQVSDGDENVFDIQQGVAIGIFRTAKIGNDPGSIEAGRLAGSRETKYRTLVAKSTALAPIVSAPPYHFFIAKKHDQDDPYLTFPSYKDMFEVYGPGIKTERDAVAIHNDREAIETVVNDFQRLSETDIRSKYGLHKDSRDWTVKKAKADTIANAKTAVITRLQYRPFDYQWTWYSGKSRGFIGTPGSRVALQMLRRKNLGLITNRQIVSEDFTHIFVSNLPISHGTFYLGNKGQDYLAPLYLSGDDDESQAGLKFGDSNRLNFTDGFLERVSATLLLERPKGSVPAGLTPEDILHYAYAVFHSPGYRSRYAEFLKIDFPRLPLTGDLELFRALARLGGELTALHLLESPMLDHPTTELIGGRGPEVEKSSWSNDTVWIDKAQSIGFRGVREEVWKFHIGGYQVCEKWLKDRKGRTLSKDDIAHYQKIVVALSETIRLMGAIDVVIDKHGGWPDAFQTAGTGAVAANDPVADAPIQEHESKPSPDKAFLKPAQTQLRLAAEPESPVYEVEKVRAKNDAPPDIETLDVEVLLCEIRQVFNDGTAREREQAIVEIARALGYQRTGSRINEVLDNAIRTAVRRGILENNKGQLTLVARTIEEYERNFLKDQFLASLQGKEWQPREDAIRHFARWLGFKRTGTTIEETALSLINGLIREKRLYSDLDNIRKS
jgi:hypothetical protein